MRCLSACLIVLTLLTATEAGGDDRSLLPGEGILVLRNGHVIRGHITRLGDRYLVAFGDSGEVRLPAKEVEFQCRDLEEAYARKRESVDPRNLRHRLDLGEWCLRHELLHRSADQLLAALTINPFDPRALALRRRLLHAAEARRIAEASSMEAGADVDWSAIEEAVANTPARAVEMFASSVQPLLLNRCGTNACHGSQAGAQFRLLRPLTDSQSLPRRLTQRNLHAALQIIDAADPDRSPLLTIPLGPHGGQPAGLFEGRDERQWEQLRAWVRIAAPSPAGPERDQPATQTAGVPAAAAPPPSVVRPPEIHRSVFTGRPAMKDAEAGASDEAPGKPSHDPFDPDIFNRRYFPEKEIPSTAKLPEEPASRK
jgi:hypothetical protein